jgi:hypothetical protein
MGTGGPFPGGKAQPVRDADQELGRSYNSSPPSAFMACGETALAFYHLVLRKELQSISFLQKII